MVSCPIGSGSGVSGPRGPKPKGVVPKRLCTGIINDVGSGHRSLVATGLGLIRFNSNGYSTNSSLS